MALAFALEVGKDIVVCPEEASATAFAFAFVVVALEAPEVTPELPHWLVREAAPLSLGPAISHEDGKSCLLLGHVGCVRATKIFLTTV